MKFGMEGISRSLTWNIPAPAPSGLTVTITASSPTYLQGAASEYSGVATTGALDQAAAASGNSTSVDSRLHRRRRNWRTRRRRVRYRRFTRNRDTGLLTGEGVRHTGADSIGIHQLEEHPAGNAGAQDERATLSTSTDWHAAVGVFHQFGQGDTQPPTVPTGLQATSATSTTIGLSCTASTDYVGVAGYTVYRNGVTPGIDQQHAVVYR